MARPRNQDARRAALGDAVRRAVLERGIDGLRLKDVAHQAGITSAAVLYYYDGVEELVAETYRVAIDRFCRQREEAARSHGDARAALLACIEVGIASGPTDEPVRLLIELIPRSLRDPAVAALDEELYTRQEAVYRDVLARGRENGQFTLTSAPDDLSATFVALEDGFQLEVLAGRKTHAEAVAHIATYACVVTGAEIGPQS